MNLNEALQKYVNENFDSPDGAIYHYTSPEAIKIIQNCKFLKLSSHHFLNNKDKDNQELKTGVDIINKRLSKSSIFNYQHRFEEYIREGIIFYTSSFCKNEQSNHALKKYGMIRVEFDSEFLRLFTTKKRVTLFGSVKYEKWEQERIISDMFGLYEDYNKFSLDPIEDLLVWVHVVLPLFKEDKNYEDNECRIVQAEIWKNGILWTPLCSKKIEFLNGNIKIYSL